ncbi:alpha/beta hydrolase [Sphingomonas sp. ID1715]|uniref:alpha/beta fold hydrolase n=1 Tax=Sphingomonas sp. ID1715 TaxID=1656898 RepID=UPI0014883408|nr:alpha/beta hydrolase [Sphingomonas sp. ID1715]NNM75841.1 alpha/beta hydrolase [Sphingomonas sp. ID1715]
MAHYTDGYWWNDELRLHYRDYAGGADGRPVILCMPGLTRNARDYESLAERLAPDWRVLSIEFRGRGESAYSKNPASYTPLIYALDVQALIRELELTGLVAIGTSLGGLVTLLMAEGERERIRGVVLNDVGPELNSAGIDRIRAYVGRSASWPTWLHAARALADTQRAAFPDYAIEDWLRMAKRLYRLSSGGRIVLDYDTRIAEPMKTAGDQPPADLWPAIAAIADVPTLVVRGELSDVLAPATVERMTQILNQAEAVTVPRIGHAPTLDEPEAAAAVDRLLAQVLANG